MRIGFYVVFLMGLCILASAQNTMKTAPELSTVVRATLALADPKRTYRSGEPIRLVLALTADEPGYALYRTTEKPMLSLDTLIVSPKAVVFPWLELAYGFDRTTDFASINDLSTEPTTIKFNANDFVRFDTPGTYILSIRTSRAYKKGDNEFAAFAVGSRLPLETNSVKVTIVPMEPGFESQEVSRLDQLIDSTSDVFTRERYTEELGYLSGDVATRDKVSRLLSPRINDGNYQRALSLGLLVSRNRTLALSMFEQALNDPSTVPTHELLSHLIGLRRLDEVATAWERKHDIASALAAADATRLQAIRSDYVRKLLATFPQRNGKSLVQASIILLEYMRPYGGDADSSILAAIRPILLHNLSSVEFYERDRVLTAFWKELKDPSLVPVLEQSLAESHGAMPYVREHALEHLLELDPLEARAYFIEEIRDPDSRVSIEVLKKLKETALPEVDDALVKMISSVSDKSRDTQSRLEAQAPRIARFGSASVYAQVKALYLGRKELYSARVRANLLAYLARYSESDAEGLIRDELKASREGEIRDSLDGLTVTDYSPLVARVLRERLESNDGETVSDAAWRLSNYSTIPDDKELLMQRLSRWRREWSARVAEIDAGHGPDPISSQAAIEREIVLGLLHGKAWRFTADEALSLKKSCLTKLCKDQFPNLP
jgi:hypothetical protein